MSGQHALTIGEIPATEDFTQWVFDEEKPLVGVYGRYWDDITQMGFITLDTACQALIEEEEPEVIDDEPEEV